MSQGIPAFYFRPLIPFFTYFVKQIMGLIHFADSFASDIMHVTNEDFMPFSGPNFYNERPTNDIIQQNRKNF